MGGILETSDVKQDVPTCKNMALVFNKFSQGAINILKDKNNIPVSYG